MLLSWPMNDALELVEVVGGVKVAQRGGDESIRTDLPLLESTDVNSLP